MSTGNGGSECNTYDTPKPATPVNYDCPKTVCRTSISASQQRFDTSTITQATKLCSTPLVEESYDVPRPLNNFLHHQYTLTPSSSNSSLLTSESLSLSFSSSNRSSLTNMPDYDVPRRNPMPVRLMHQQTLVHHHNQQQHNQQNSTNCSSMTYDVPLPSIQSTTIQEPSQTALQGPVVGSTKELPLELPLALETLAKLQSEATTAITRLLAFVSPNWRLREKLEVAIMEVQLAAVRLRTVLHDLVDFVEGAFANATFSDDRTLWLKLRPLVTTLRDAYKLIYDSCNALDLNSGWSVDALARSENKSCKPPDNLDQLIACAQTLTEDVRQTTSFIQGNASLLFRRNSDANNITTNNSTLSARSEWLEDYDYVSFESKDAAAESMCELREVIPSHLKNKFDDIIKAAETAAIEDFVALPTVKGRSFTDKDKLLMRYYAVQISTHMGNLRQAIDSFLETVEKNQPPKFFIAYGKFVVVSAHNLVTVGDYVHRNVSQPEMREKVLRCTDALSEALKTCVTKSKKAAANFPSVTAVQEMVDSIVDISHLASDLKTTMLYAVQLTRE